VSAIKVGKVMPYSGIRDTLISRLSACRAKRVTLTGGEPTIHPEFIPIVRSFRAAGMKVGICTNGTTLTEAQITELSGIGEVHVNVSLDGFRRATSHGLSQDSREWQDPAADGGRDRRACRRHRSDMHRLLVCPLCPVSELVVSDLDRRFCHP
jgi:MoaA/NifB/PqqE/SkfB family radical SAM enzyme